MKLFQLNKTAILFQNNAMRFLNGLTSNSMDKTLNAFLNIHGRIIATFEQLVLNEEDVLIVVEKDFLSDVLSHLEKYAKLSGVKTTLLDHRVYFDLEGNYAVQQDEYAINQKKGKIVVTPKELKINVSEDEFTLFRLHHQIPLHGVDYKDEMLLNLNEVDYVSFTKGCFLGQEPISKVHNRSKPTWRLVVKAFDRCSEEEKLKMTSKIIDPQARQTLGFVFARNE